MSDDKTQQRQSEAIPQTVDALREVMQKELRCLRKILATWDIRDRRDRGEDGFDG